MDLQRLTVDALGKAKGACADAEQLEMDAQEVMEGVQELIDNSRATAGVWRLDEGRVEARFVCEHSIQLGGIDYSMIAKLTVSALIPL